MARIQIPLKMALAFTAVGAVALLVSGLISYRSARTSLETESFNKLTAVRELKAQQVEAYFRQVRNQVVTLSRDRMIVDATGDLRTAFRNVERDLGTTRDRNQAIESRLRTYYVEEMLPRLNRLRIEAADIEEVWPSHGAHPLQDLYISSNSYPLGEKHKLESAGDRSAYSAHHERIHPILRDYLERFGYYDIFIIDPDTGHIIYSVFKEVDFATSLTTGPYKKTNLAAAFLSALQADEPDFARLVDYQPYAPSFDQPASFIASPIFDGNRLIGVLAFQMPVGRINDIMTSNEAWADVGLGESGETYLVGEDFTLRNQSRFLIEDRENYLRMVSETGAPQMLVEKIRAFDSSIGLQTVKTAGTEAALRGEEGTRIFPDYRGVPVLSSYKPLELTDVRWVIMSEIDEAEAFRPVYRLRNWILGTSVVLVALFALISNLVSRTLTNPLRVLRAKARKLAQGQLQVEIDTSSRDEIGELSRSFDSMRRSIKELVDELQESNETLESRVAERTADLESANERIKAILENASDAVITHDADGKIVLFNPEAEKIFGYTADEIMGRSIDELVPEEVRARHSDLVAGFAREDATSRSMGTRLEISGQRKDGSMFSAEVGISKMQMGNELLMTAFVRDVSERKRAEQAILEQKQLLEHTIESLTHPFYVIDANTYEILVSNQAANKAAGGKVTTCHAMTHLRDTPCDSTEDPCPLDAVKRTGKPVIMEHTHFDAVGNTTSAEVHGYPIFDDQGNVVQMIEYSLDITKRKQVEAQLRLQSAALESAANGIVITDPEGNIEWVNPAFNALTGYSSEEAVGQNPRLLKSGEHPPEFYKALWETIASGRVWRDEIINRRKDGSHYTEEMTITPVLGDDGKTAHFVAIKQDVTTRKELESKLREAFQVIKAQKERMEDELNVAREIQMSMLPLIFPAFPDRREFEVFATLTPARQVGGDFYDFFFIDERRFCVGIGDVSDKGVPAALFMAVTKTLMKSRAMDDLSTASILTHVNDELSRENDSSMFVTVFLAILDITTGIITYTNAGHNPPYIRRGGGELVRLDQRHGPVVAAMEGVTYSEAREKLDGGDLILLYTDGVTEAMNSARDLFGEEQLREVLCENADGSAELVVQRLGSKVREFEAGAEQADDTTILGLQFLGLLEQSAAKRLLELRLKNEFAEIDNANRQVIEFAEALGIDKKFRRQLNVVLDELLNNIISYAYEDDEEHEILVNVELAGRRLVVSITDDGIPFNAFSQKEPDTEAKLEDRAIGGLGIHLVRKLMDEVHYQRGIGRNVVTLVKQLEGTSE